MKRELGQELDGMSAILASPSYGPVDPACQKALRIAMMTAGNHGLQWGGDVSTDKEKFADGRNRSARYLFENPETADGIMWVDSDIIPEPVSILRLIYNGRRMGCEFIAGIYHKKGEPFEPVIYHYDRDSDKYLVIEDYHPEHNTVVPIEACGFGFCWTSAKCIQAIAALKDFDKESGMWFPDTRNMPPDWRGPDGRPGFGEDFSFCDKARRAGVQLYVDVACVVGHKGDGSIYNRDTYLSWLKTNGGRLKFPDKERWRG